MIRYARKRVLFEGAQGVDNCCTYPFVTSSNPVAGGAHWVWCCPSTDKVVGVCKATQVVEMVSNWIIWWSRVMNMVQQLAAPDASQPPCIWDYQSFHWTLSMFWGFGYCENLCGLCILMVNVLIIILPWAVETPQSTRKQAGWSDITGVRNSKTFPGDARNYKLGRVLLVSAFNFLSRSPVEQTNSFRKCLVIGDFEDYFLRQVGIPYRTVTRRPLTCCSKNPKLFFFIIISLLSHPIAVLGNHDTESTSRKRKNWCIIQRKLQLWESL